MWRWAGAAQRGRTERMERGIAVDQASWLVVDEREEREEEIYCPRKHRWTGGAETPKTFVMLIVLSCGSSDWKRWRTELHLGGSESFKDHHGASTLRTAPKIFRTIGS